MKKIIILNFFNGVTTKKVFYCIEDANEYFNKVSKEYDTDIDCFCNKALAHFSTTKEWEDYNWPEKFKTAKFDIDVNIDTISSMLLTKT